MYADGRGNAATEEDQMLYFECTSLLILRYHRLQVINLAVSKHGMPCDKTGITVPPDFLPRPRC